MLLTTDVTRDPGHPNTAERQEISERARHEPDRWFSSRRIDAAWDQSGDGWIIGGRRERIEGLRVS